MPSAALARWQTNRTPRLNEVEAHCASVLALVPNPTFPAASLDDIMYRKLLCIMGTAPW
jgi:hypothetical protein